MILRRLPSMCLPLGTHPTTATLVAAALLLWMKMRKGLRQTTKTGAMRNPAGYTAVVGVSRY
ncbi:unnamed protein product [Ectocarpus sp. CCAP 1310/34]|nr:unnamed protein product [Ectocarpus sp. CCAP 1310/34]